MKTTVMFINHSEPLAGVPVRIGEDDTSILITDEEGKIDVELGPGEHQFEIQLNEEWRSRTVSREGTSSFFVVDMGRTDTTRISSLNTLQMDLSQLVGDRYVFETILGRGGMGVVVKAVDRLLNRPVAIKMLNDELRENEEAQQIFLVEARNLATLSHPNLVAIHDILNIEGRVLMIFEYVLGENLEDIVVRENGLAQERACQIGIQLCRVVAYLHEHELIHRDLKPSNIIVQSDGTLKLIDFGLARSLQDIYVRGTRVRGTPAYMAPEQVQGITLTRATDLYQIGISMYEIIAGDLPFPTGDMAYAHVHKQAPPLSENTEVDPELAALIHQCLKKQPRERPNSAEELLERLQRIHARLKASEPIRTVALFEESSSEAEALPATPTPRRPSRPNPSSPALVQQPPSPGPSSQPPSSGPPSQSSGSLESSTVLDESVPDRRRKLLLPLMLLLVTIVVTGVLIVMNVTDGKAPAEGEAAAAPAEAPAEVVANEPAEELAGGEMPAVEEETVELVEPMDRAAAISMALEAATNSLQMARESLPTDDVLDGPAAAPAARKAPARPTPIERPPAPKPKPVEKKAPVEPAKTAKQPAAEQPAAEQPAAEQPAAEKPQEEKAEARKPKPKKQKEPESGGGGLLSVDEEPQDDGLLLPVD